MFGRTDNDVTCTKPLVVPPVIFKNSGIFNMRTARFATRSNATYQDQTFGAQYAWQRPLREREREREKPRQS